MSYQYLSNEKENISEAINGEICKAYQETIELEINALEKIKQNRKYHTKGRKRKWQVDMIEILMRIEQKYGK